MARAPIDPNLITAMRIPLAPVAVATLLSGTPWGLALAAVLALGLELTDVADGWMARRYQQVSDFGKLFDPFSDAFTRYTLFLGMYAYPHAVPGAVHIADLWMVVAIFWRDASVSFFRQVSAARHVVVAARPSGKIKAIVQGVGTQVVFIALALEPVWPGHGLAEVPYWTMLVMTLVTIASFFDYFVGHLPLLTDAWNNRPPRKRASGDA